MTLTRYDNLFQSISDRIQQAQISQGSSHPDRRSVTYISTDSPNLDRTFATDLFIQT